MAADANLAGQTYPDQSLYPANSVPAVVRRLNNAMLRADQIERAEGKNGTSRLAPIVADAEAGFGGPPGRLRTDEGDGRGRCGGRPLGGPARRGEEVRHLGGKVLVPTSQFVRTLVAARLAADVLDVPTVLVARTDSPARRC